MSGAPSCCLSCLVYNDDFQGVKDYLDSYGLSDSQAMFMARCLLRKATVDESRLKNFLLEDGTEANVILLSNYSGLKSTSAVPLYWNGNVLWHTVKPNNIDTMWSLLQVRHASDWFNNLRTYDYWDLLHMALKLDNTGVAKALLDHLYSNKSPPHRCDATNNLETVKSLLHTNADINSKTCDDVTPLELAIRLAKQEIYKIIWNPSYFNETPLYGAAASGDTNVLKNLLRKNADIEERSYDDMTPLHISAQLGRKYCTEILLEHGADTNSLCTWALEKLLYDAVLNGQVGVVELLLRKGVDINTKIKSKSSMHVLAMERNREINKRLNKDTDIDVQDKNNETILGLVFELRNLQLIEVILKIRAEPGSSLAETQLKVLEDILRYDFRVDSEESQDCSLFHSAIRNACLTIVEYLLNLGGKFNVESRTKNGATPLHTAVTYMHSGIARLLIKNHADVNAKDGYGKTPLHVLDSSKKCMYINRFKHKHRSSIFDYATFDECKDLVELLLEHKADVNSLDAEKETPLHSAVRDRNEVIVKILLDKGAAVNAKRTDGRTALHLAAKHGTPKIINLLLDHNADINLLSNDGKTALDYASRNVADDLRSYVIKMITLNRWVCERNLQAINLLDSKSPVTWDGRRPDCCKREIENMRQEKIGVSNVSYYDVLTKSMSRLVLFARNKDIVRAVDKGRHKRMFPLYSSMFYHRFKSGQERASGLLDSSIESFRFLTGYPLQDLTIILIFEYLNNGDLKNLIKAARAMIDAQQTEHEHGAGATCDLESTE